MRSYKRGSRQISNIDFNMFWFYTLVILSLSVCVFNNGINNNYGPYKINWGKYETCKGPKRSDCGKLSIEDKTNMSDIIFALDFPIDCPVTKAKITVSTNEINSKKKLLNYAVDSPCQHFVLGPFLNEAFNLTEKACKVNKGVYRIHVNMQDKSRKFFGSSFFYGNYTLKLIAHNRINNFFCVEHVIVIEKRKP